MPYICQTALTELPILCDTLAGCLVPPVVLLLTGNLGTGKTTFMQFLGQSLGIKEQITSPTFTLIDEYYSGSIPLYHIDLYRLAPDAVADLHLELYWQGQEFPPGITAIEWSERLTIVPSSFIQVQIEQTKIEDQRLFTWHSQGEDAKTMLDNFWQALPDRLKQCKLSDTIGEGDEGRNSI
jgi:tRNA threonylcarbamoyladenosine biosynthesis protein TsaE